MARSSFADLGRIRSTAGRAVGLPTLGRRAGPRAGSRLACTNCDCRSGTRWRQAARIRIAVFVIAPRLDPGAARRAIPELRFP